MVQCAIRDLADDQGSSEPAISAYIQAHYDSLPWAHSRLLPYYLHKLILAGEITRSPSSLPVRYFLPQNPSPNPIFPRKRGRPPKGSKPYPKPKPLPLSPKRGRGRPRKITSPEPELQPGLTSPRPRLILKLKRSKAILVDPNGGVCAGSSWQCLREEARVQGNEGLDGIEADEQKEGFDGTAVDEHYDELLALRESDVNGIMTGKANEEFMSLQDDELNGIAIDEHGKDLNGVKGKEDCNGEMLASPDKDEEMNCIMTGRPNGEFMSLQDDKLKEITIDEHGKDLNGIKGKEHVEDSNGELLALPDKDEEMDCIMADNLNKDLSSTKSKEHVIDGCNVGLMALQVCSYGEASLLKSEQRTSHKKAKVKKTRRLWYEG